MKNHETKYNITEKQLYEIIVKDKPKNIFISIPRLELWVKIDKKEFTNTMQSQSLVSGKQWKDNIKASMLNGDLYINP